VCDVGILWTIQKGWADEMGAAEVVTDGRGSVFGTGRVGRDAEDDDIV
jgi:hypothetical protein